jgi:hypothetical protein
MAEQSKPPLTDLEKIILEILLETKDNSLPLDDLAKEAAKRQTRIDQLKDIK